MRSRNSLLTGLAALGFWIAFGVKLLERLSTPVARVGRETWHTHDTLALGGYLLAALLFTLAWVLLRRGMRRHAEQRSRDAVPDGPAQDSEQP